MANKKVDLFTPPGLGDISDIMCKHCVSDLSWLEVDQDDYHKSEALPKQNLDIIPELQRSLTYGDADDIPHVVSMKPYIIVNSNPLDQPDSPSRHFLNGEIRNNVAKYAMVGMKPNDIKEKIFLQYSPNQIRSASNEISAVMEDYGLLGNVYINASHFPRCAQDSDDKDFVLKRTKDAKFVIAKNECSGCVHNKDGNCANLHKQIVGALEYNNDVLNHYAAKLSSCGRLNSIAFKKVASGTNSDRKKFLQISFKSPISKYIESIKTIRQTDKPRKPVITDEQMHAVLNRRSVSQVHLSSQFISASIHLMKNKNPEAILESTDSEVRKLSSELGLLGHTYIDMDALGGCKRTLAFIKNMPNIPDFVLRRNAACSTCKGACDGACSKIQQIIPIVDNPEITKDNLVLALERAVDRGAMTIDDTKRVLSKLGNKQDWKKLIAKVNFMKSRATNQVGYSNSKISAHYGMSGRSKEIGSNVVNAEDVRKTISHFMNTGLNGRALYAAVLNRYTKSELRGVSRVGSKLIQYDGVQGKFFIDPTAYSDYGKGCVTGSKHFRKRGASNVLVSDGCIGCCMQTAPGWCAKYAKSLIRDVPKELIVEAKSLKKLPIIATEEVENPVEKYGLDSSISFEPKNIGLNKPDIIITSKSIENS